MNLKKPPKTYPLCLALSSKKGMSLVEVMIVLVIIASLTAALAMVVQGRMQKSRIQNTKIILSNVSKAIEIFYVDCGFYPNSLDDLIEAPESCGSDWGPVAYIKKKKFPPKDAWKKPLIYESDGDSYVLKSLGKDGREGGTGEKLDLSSDSI